MKLRDFVVSPSETEGRLVTLLFYSVTRSFAPTSFSCKSGNS